MIDSILDACTAFVRTDRPPVDATGDVFADILLAAVFVHMARQETLSGRLDVVLRYDVPTCPEKALPVIRKWAGELHDAATIPRKLPPSPWRPFDDYGRQRAAATEHSPAARPIPIVTAEQYREMTRREGEEFERGRRIEELEETRNRLNNNFGQGAFRDGQTRTSIEEIDAELARLKAPAGIRTIMAWARGE